MTEKWRFLVTDANNAYMNMAIDRAILKANSEGLALPTVRFYYWDPAAITIGYFQSLKDEVNLEKCKTFGIDYVRRITGGGAVFHENELTYSIVVPESHKKMPNNIMDSYGSICGAVMRGLNNFGIECKYHPINDILADGKKLSGNAQTRKHNTVLQHGTILLDVDVEKMFSVLRVPNEKIKDKLISNVKDRVTSVKHIVGKKIVFTDILNDMKKGFEDEFNVELVDGKLTDYELKLADKYDRECFSTDGWNNKK